MNYLQSQLCQPFRNFAAGCFVGDEAVASDDILQTHTATSPSPSSTTTTIVLVVDVVVVVVVAGITTALVRRTLQQQWWWARVRGQQRRVFGCVELPFETAPNALEGLHAEPLAALPLPDGLSELLAIIAGQVVHIDARGGQKRREALAFLGEWDHLQHVLGEVLGSGEGWPDGFQTKLEALLEQGSVAQAFKELLLLQLPLAPVVAGSTTTASSSPLLCRTWDCDSCC
mmetsp:Transcript_46369/g.99315  ORF Transcript_46369/g.99315 Transcript_46369/m.99315 type:complete len:229 (-) Transcript_46369:465-1151(-)